MMGSGSDRTELHRCNEPDWEPQELLWHRPGTFPEPGTYWFDGFYKPEHAEEMQGRAIIYIAEKCEVVVGMFLTGETFVHRGIPAELYGEWYGPFECPPWFGDAMSEPIEDSEVECGSGI